MTTVIYTGLFKIFDNIGNVADLNTQAPSPSASPSIIKDPNLPQETAIVTRRPLTKATKPVVKPGNIQNAVDNIKNNIKNNNNLG